MVVLCEQAFYGETLGAEVALSRGPGGGGVG